MREISNITRLLPAEMLERVFHLLPPRDLQAVVLVCRWWREVGEVPELWVWVYLRVWRENIGYMPEVLDSRRLQAVRRVEVREVMSEELLQAVVRHPGLREMAIMYTDLSSVNPQLLAQAVTALDQLDARRAVHHPCDIRGNGGGGGGGSGGNGGGGRDMSGDEGQQA